jgi:uncharacterized protein with HEPN domain
MNPHHNPRGPMLDMREYARRVVELTAGQTEQALAPGGDWRIQANLDRLLEVIGEAANRVPKEIHAQFPQMPGIGSASGWGRVPRQGKCLRPRAGT